MTRFWITLKQGVSFVIRSLETMHGGEIFVPKIASMKLVDMATAIAPECDIDFIGIRPGEKLHETLISEDEARLTLESKDMYIIRPNHPWWSNDNWANAVPVAEGFRYSSDSNPRWLTAADLQEFIVPVPRGVEPRATM
jgi:UDP-N-acetylglucosamine 4,6-dehydratase